MRFDCTCEIEIRCTCKTQFNTIHASLLREVIDDAALLAALDKLLRLQLLLQFRHQVSGCG